MIVDKVTSSQLQHTILLFLQSDIGLVGAIVQSIAHICSLRGPSPLPHILGKFLVSERLLQIKYALLKPNCSLTTC